MKNRIGYSEESLNETAKLLVSMNVNSEEGIFGKSTVDDYKRLLRRYMYKLVANPESIYIGTCGFLIIKSVDGVYVDINFYVDPMTGKW
jgi:hypothetical protein